MSSMGRTAEISLRIDPPDTADPATSPSRRVPAVLATSQLIELMELAALRCLQPQLADGCVSVSISTNVRHAVLAGLSGEQLRITATCCGVAGRFYQFEVNAFDARGLVASCEHTRAVAVERRLLAIARRRIGQPAMLLMP